MIHFRILDETLCGAPYTEPSAKAAKDGRLCHDCVQVMWKEEYRRNTLMPLIKKHGVSVKETDELAVKLKSKHTEDDSHQAPTGGLFLSSYEKEI